MKYSTITKEATNTICAAYPDVNGIESAKGLNEYESSSEGAVELIFTESMSAAVELLKTF